MTIIGFNFTKISAEKTGPARGKITVNRKCNPTGVSLAQIGTGQKALKYTFEFGVDYEPGIAKMEFEGSISELLAEDKAKEVLESWEKNKRLPPKVLERVMNGILNRCHTEALLMAKEMQIPAPFNLPSVKVTPKGDKPAAKEE